ADEHEGRLLDYLRSDGRRGFDLGRPPLMRLGLFRLAESRYLLIWSFHHALMDGRSFPLVLKDVFALYGALCEGGMLEMSRPRSYRDYIDWLLRRDLSAAERYWKQTLDAYSLPAGPGAAGEGPSSEPGRRELRLSPGLVSGLEFFARSHGLTVNTLLQGAWALLLGHYYDRDDVVFGVTRAGRHATVEGAESMVGLFINTLPLR